ncbi:MAG: tetratricopeptide repeat protein [Actinomycetota bacterium]|nr:tetratricopeptide repeat protein [Actinomycetota bacterium]
MAAEVARRQVLGDDHPYTLRSAHSLAVVLANLGEQAVRRGGLVTVPSRVGPCGRRLTDDHL